MTNSLIEKLLIRNSSNHIKFIKLSSRNWWTFREYCSARQQNFHARTKICRPSWRGLKVEVCKKRKFSMTIYPVNLMWGKWTVKRQSTKNMLAASSWGPHCRLNTSAQHCCPWALLYMDINEVLRGRVGESCCCSGWRYSNTATCMRYSAPMWSGRCILRQEQGCEEKQHCVSTAGYEH